MRFRVVHHYSTKPEVEFIPDRMCPPNRAYLLASKETPFQYLKSVRQAELERNEWIRKYDNLKKGLEDWRDKALENE